MSRKKAAGKCDTKGKSEPTKEERLEEAIAEIEREFGCRSMDLSVDDVAKIEGIHSGSVGLDIALGRKGFPKGRIIELFGQESTGKSTLCLKAAAACQQNGGTVAYIDAEHASDPVWMEKLGVNLKKLKFMQPNIGEEALGIVHRLLEKNACDLIITDSVAALTPRVEMEGDMGDCHVGNQARMMGQAMRKLTSMASDSKCTLLFTNQMRMKIGTMGNQSPWETPGGKALKFYSSCRIELKKIQTMKDAAGNFLGIKIKATVVKNKVAAPYRTAEYEITPEFGLCRELEILNLGIEQKHVKASGAWLSFGDDRLGCGKANAVRFLMQNPDIQAAIEDLVLNGEPEKQETEDGIQ